MLFSATLRKRAKADQGEARPKAAPRPALPLIEPVTTGLLPQTQVATARGWMPVGRLQPGDMVLTFDHGTQPLCDVVALPPEEVMRPADEKAISIPTGALENRSPMVLLPGQAVLLESDHAEALFGDPFALVPAAALIGLRGITAVDMPDDPGLCPRFNQDQIIYAHGATLLFCPAASRADAAQVPLAIREARKLVERLIEDEEDSVADGAAPLKGADTSA